MEIGSIIAYPIATVPDGFLLCDGSNVSRDDYSDLFAIIGTTYGVGDGSTTFGLPNLTGRAAMSKSSGHAIGSTGGEESHVLTTGEIAQHLHSVPSHTHAHTIKATTPKFTHTVGQPAYKYTKLNGSANGGGSQTTTYNFYSSVTSAAMTRSTNLAISAHGAAACTMSGSITNCSALTSGSAGSGTAHNNMMPYLALTYIIRYAPDTPPTPRILLFNGAMPVTAQGYYLVGSRS